MKNAIARLVSTAALLAVSTPALADKIDCSFTEPFFSVKIDDARKSVIVHDAIEKKSTSYKIRKIKQTGRTTEILYGNQEELTTLVYTLDFKGSDGMSETIFPYSAETRTGDTRPHFGGCSSAQFPATESVLDCNNLGDAIEFKVCENSLAIECEDAASRIVAGIQSIRAAKKIEIVRVQQILRGQRYAVRFKVEGDTALQTNYVTTAQAPHGASCGATSVESRLK